MTSAINPAQVRTTDMKLEVIVIPVSDVDRAKQFYGGLGWRLDADFVRVTTGARSSVPATSMPLRWSSSAKISPRLHPARLQAYTSLLPISRLLAQGYSVAA